MPESHNEQRCLFCKIGNVAKGDQNIVFKQSTDKGYIVCNVAIPVDTCDHCGMKTWDYNAEAVVAEAVRQNYENLSKV